MHVCLYVCMYVRVCVDAELFKDMYRYTRSARFVKRKVQNKERIRFVRNDRNL